MAVNINVPSQVKTYANLAAFPASGALKTIYIAEDTNKTYRWTGSVYVEVSASASGITIGTTAITSGTVGRVLFEGTGNVVQESANLFWDNTNGRLGIGGVTPFYNLIIYNASAPSFALQNSSRVWQHYLSGSNYRFGTSAADMINIAGATGNVQIGTNTDAGYRLDVNGTARVSGNTVVTTWLGVGGVTTPSGAGEKFNVQGAQVISGSGGAGNFLLYQISGASRFIVGSEASIGGTANNYINYVYGNNSHITYTNNVARLSVTGGGNVLINTATDVASSQLTIDSTTKGFLPPRMTTTQKNAIASPATGLQIYDTTLNRPCFYDGTTWITL